MRRIPGSFDEDRDTFDVDFLHDLPRLGRQDVLWGAGLRSTSDQIGNTQFATFDPASRSDQTASALHNANDARHLEFGEGRFVERSAFLRVIWTF